MLTLGPVPSRRLGRSLGINNIPPKACTYFCVYCQVGPTKNTEIVPRLFYTPEQIFLAVEKHLSLVQKKGEQMGNQAWIFSYLKPLSVYAHWIFPSQLFPMPR